MAYYRFKNSTFVDAESFEEAKRKLIEEIEQEQEESDRWSPYTCLGLQHRHGCPEMAGIVPF